MKSQSTQTPASHAAGRSFQAEKVKNSKEQKLKITKELLASKGAMDVAYRQAIDDNSPQISIGADEYKSIRALCAPLR